jgi:hypothetical protein
VQESEVTALLDVIFNGISDFSSDGAYRQICSKCIQEFFVWSIKQSTKKEMFNHPLSIDALMKKLFVMIAHPSHEKRLAATTIFNHIYKNLREESSLIHRYAMQSILLLLKSLRLESNSAAQMVFFLIMFFIIIVIFFIYIV